MQCAIVNAQVVPANKLPPTPSPRRLVVDYAHLLTNQEVALLESKLVAYDKATSNQILIITLHSTQGYEADAYATEIGHRWGVGGQAKMDNGIVILVSDGTEETDNRRKAFIATGYGLEGTMNAITTKHIVDQFLIPKLKRRDYYEAFEATTNIIQQTIAGEYKAPKGYGQKDEPSFPPLLIVLIIFIVLFIVARTKGGGGSSGGMMSRRGFRGWNNAPPIIWFPSSGSGGSSSGGGFGGFGGGSFGGGGAGGDW
jgi:uncharacterized protein